MSTLNKEWTKNLDDANDSGNFSVRGYISLIQKDSVTDMHGLAVHAKEKLLFAQDLYLENSAVSNLCFLLTLLHLVPYFFLLYWWPSSSLCTICDAISSKTDELSINQPANMLVFGDFSVHHKDWLTFLGGTDRPGELSHNFFYLKLLYSHG